MRRPCQSEVHENAVLDGFRLMHLICEVVNSKLKDGGGHFSAFALKHIKPEVRAAGPSRIGSKIVCQCICKL